MFLSTSLNTEDFVNYVDQAYVELQYRVGHTTIVIIVNDWKKQYLSVYFAYKIDHF